MNEDYVSTKLARKLQQKGYPLKKVYRQDGAPLFYDLPQDHPDWSQCDAWYLPTIWEVLKWLRKEKKIYVVPLICSDWSEDADGIICEEWLFWSYRVINVNDGRIVYDELDKIDNGNFEDYEQAALAGIEYVIDNLI